MKIALISACIFLSGMATAQAQFFSYPQWEAMPQQERSVYLAGAFDLLISTETAEEKFREHYKNCIVSSKVNLGQLAEYVRVYASTRPALQNRPVSGALINYLTELCGRPPQR